MPSKVMDTKWIDVLQRLQQQGVPCALATVVEIRGSASAKPGAKAIFDANGQNLHGWVGGGCAESMVSQAAVASIRDGQTRIVEVDLDDEVLGAGMPCGGTMRVYVEPQLKPSQLVLLGHGRIVESLAHLGELLGFAITVDDPRAKPESFPASCHLITEDPDFSALELDQNTYMVVAAHQATDHLAVEKALNADVRYVALVASAKRAKLIWKRLQDRGASSEQLERLHTPAGLDLGAITPEEIAVSIIAEIIACHRGGSGTPLTRITGVPGEIQPAQDR